MKYQLFFIAFCYYGTAYASIAHKNNTYDAKATKKVSFCVMDVKNEIEMRRRDRCESRMTIEQLCQIPIGWLTQKQLSMLRTKHHMYPKAHCFNDIELPIHTLMQLHPSLLTYAELMVFEHITKKIVDFNDRGTIVVKKK
ncbi:MAG TPA: hypothetical protein VLG50_02230 [Candidatus Saccharimonadales bacterium]|nr:hypothetical protein [Candidatus Saccharimonadales bacterium]